MDGVLNILKPPGMTSSNVVSDLRRLCGEKRVGHTGTLDPGAAGVLPVCLGRATRLFDYLLEKDKSYRAEITFGTATDTLDAYGKVLFREPSQVNKADFLRVLPRFVGELEQVPPLYSALKQNGKKLYELARAGQEDEDARLKKRRTVRIYSIDYVAQTGEQSFLFDVTCSRGTYIRTLCEQIASSLGCCAYLSFLLRTRSGGFAIEHALTIAEAAAAAEQGILERCLVPMDAAVGFLPRAGVDAGALRLVQNGNPIPLGALVERPAGTDCPCRVYCGEVFAGIGTLDEEFLRMKAVLCR